MFATAEIFLLPSSNSALPLRKSGRQRSGRKKNPNRLNLWVSWWGLGGRGFLPTSPDNEKSVLFRLLARICSPPAPAPSISWIAWRTQPLGTETSTPTPLFPQEHQLLLPSIPPLTSQFRYSPGRITFPQRKTSFAFLSAQYNVGRRVTPASLQTGKNHAHIIRLQGSSVGATGTFSYDEVPILSRETPTLFLPGSA